MYNVIRVVHFDESASASARSEYIEAARIAVKETDSEGYFVAPTLPGVINGGDVLIHLRFPSADVAARHASRLDAELRTPIAAYVDGVGYSTAPAQTRPDEPRSIYRVLLVRVDPDTPAETVEQFETDLLKMPRYIPSIVAWRLSPVTDTIGRTGWTHVWEQEFTDHDALMGQYLNHPVHWSIVDRWFDPECPEVIVRERVCHTFCAVDGVTIA
ncbi:Dabb family protein [Rhodococcus rhodochrous]|uniref:Dabb family protein n=1 Tax=Rhodococcus rhodochrous TaxID=1829 RepID=A0AA46WU15_RHORH|nr:Dabb family protein [Rhodococcus rhodochrous]MCB8910061.1 Dabb family protein [Rhodococcus rhodochrous]UZF44278.1 Dabb family protein [Rhodococcus rhodochrous]